MTPKFDEIKQEVLLEAETLLERELTDLEKAIVTWTVTSVLTK